MKVYKNRFQILRRHTGYLLLTACFCLGASESGWAQIRAELRVTPSIPLHKVDPHIYGQFLEHFGRVINGGLWAELLRNRKFYPVDPDRIHVADPWKPESDLSAVSYVIDRSITLDGISSQRISTFGKESSWRGIRQTGFDLLGGKEYVAYAWIRTGSGKGNVSFRLESAEGVAAAHAEVRLEPSDWKKYEVRLTPDRDLRPAVFRLAFDATGQNWVGEASLMPADNIGGMRRDVIELTKNLGPTIMRWPGGGYSDSYDWRKAIGPRERRPPQDILPYGQPFGYDNGIDSDDFGTDEYMNFCRLVGADPYISANFGSGTPEMAAQWVEYCNGSVQTTWGARRAANGHPEPYGVKYWTIGNEIWGSFELGWMNAEGYATYYAPFTKSMRAVDPTIQIVAVGMFHDPNVRTWNETVLQQEWPQIDLLSLHHYFTGLFALPEWRNNPLQAYNAIVAEPTIAEQRAREMISLMDQITAGRKKILIAFDEWNQLTLDFPPPVNTPERSEQNQFIDLLNKTGLDINLTHRDGIFGARMLQLFMRLGDRIPLAIRTHLINSLGSIRSDSTRSYITASGKVMQLYRWHSGSELVKVEQQSPEFDVPEQGWKGISYLDAAATRSADGAKLYLHLINLHPSESMGLKVAIAQSEVDPKGDLWQIAPQDFITRNDFGVTNVEITHEQKTGLRPEFTLLLPPHSISVLELQLRR